MKTFEEYQVLEEGTWSTPTTSREKIVKLLMILKQPLTPKLAKGVLYNIVGDDGLWDKFDDLIKKNKVIDVRSIILDYLKDSKIEGILNSNLSGYIQRVNNERVKKIQNNLLQSIVELNNFIGKHHYPQFDLLKKQLNLTKDYFSKDLEFNNEDSRAYYNKNTKTYEHEMPLEQIANMTLKQYNKEVLGM